MNHIVKGCAHMNFKAHKMLYLTWLAPFFDEWLEIQLYDYSAE